MHNIRAPRGKILRVGLLKPFVRQIAEQTYAYYSIACRRRHSRIKVHA